MAQATHRDEDAPPPGFVRFTIGRATAVCAEHVASAVRSVLQSGTLYDYAASHPRARALAGRGVVYAASLPKDIERVVVRHNHHGGLFAGVTRDLFPIATRAPRELRTSERLRANHVPTPAILGYVLYEVFPAVFRADVMSREVDNAFDLSAAIMAADPAARAHALEATAELVHAVVDAGAWHKDLNVKNILLHGAPHGGLQAMILDVDRVKFPGAAVNVRELNLARLLRSARKWQANYGARVTAAELDELASLIREPSSRRATTAS